MKKDKVSLENFDFDISTYPTKDRVVSVISRSNESSCDVIANINIPIVYIDNLDSFTNMVHQLSLKALFESLDIVNGIDEDKLKSNFDKLKADILKKQMDLKESNKIDTKYFVSFVDTMPESILAFFVVQNDDIVYEYKKNTNEYYDTDYKSKIIKVLYQIKSNAITIKKLINGCKSTFYITEDITYCHFKVTDEVFIVFLLYSKDFGKYIKSIEKLYKTLEENLK